jgi:PAS domain S-box-containing protein
MLGIKMESLTKRSLALRYLMALLAPALMAAVVQMTWPLFEQSPIALFLLAIMFCGWYGGFGPGLLSVLVSIPLADYFFISPYFAIVPQHRGDLIRLLVLATIGLCTSLLSALSYKEKRRAEINLDSAHQDISERKRAESRSAAFATLAGKLSGARVPLNAAQTIAGTAQELFGWESCTLGLYDADQDLVHPLLYIDTIAGERTKVTPVIADREPTPRSRQVIKYGAQLTLREAPYEFDEDSVPFGDTHRPSASVMTVPIRHSSKVIGILSIQSYRPHAYDHEALGDLQALADHCGAALNRIWAEEALRESEERYRELFENAKDATYVHDLNGRYVSVNRAAEKLSGHTRDEIIGRRFSDFIPLEEVGAVSEHLCQKLLEEGETTYETEVIASDGRRVPVKVSSHVIYENGKAIGVQGTARDITERRRAEERLREYERVVEGLEEMIVVVDRDYRYLLANRAYLKYRGRNREQVLGRLVPDVVGKDLFEAVIKEKLEQTFQGQVVSYELKTTNSELGERDLLVSYSPIEGPAGIDRAACVMQDITERKRAEEALRQSEERFSKAFHSSPASLSIALLEDGRLLEVNAAFLRMTGYNREEVIGRSTLEIGLWANPDYRLILTEKLRDGGAVDNLAFKFRKKSGELRDGLLSGELIELGAEPCVLGIAMDTTERIQAEEALQSYPRRLLEAQETERQSIARELHDQIGQVLTAIRINLQTVWDTCETSESRALIDEGVAIVDEALEQVRDLSFELRPSLLDDLGLVAALRWYSDRFARRTGIRSANAIDLPESTRLRLELETACFRIVQEALTNVVRHARARNVAITLRSLKNEICLSIKDDGRGFDAHSQRLSQFTTHLGLRGMRERALALGGRLEIKSSPSRGTEISAHFPEQSNKD